MNDEIRCMQGYNRDHGWCQNEAVWVLRLEAKPCGCSWRNKRPNTQLWCDQHLIWQLENRLGEYTARCSICGFSYSGLIISLERL